MRQVFNLATAYMPHGYCYLWNPPLVWLHVASDFLTTVAYYSIPITLFYFVRKRSDLPYPAIFMLFGAFIVSCGTTHLMEIWTLWHSTYWLSGWLKALTAAISVYTALELIPIVPQALALPSPAQLEATNQQLAQEVSDRQQFEVSLQESEARFRSAFDDAAIGMALVALDGHWLKVNNSLCNIVGYSEAELLTMTFQEITHPDDLETDLHYVRQMLTDEIRTYQMEKRYFHKSGHVIWILLSVSLIRDEQGQPLYFIPQIQDITGRRQAEQALQERESILRSFYESAPMMMGVVELGDEDIRHVYDNTASANFFGLTTEEMKGRWASELGVPENVRHFWLDYYRQSQTTDQPVHFEYTHTAETKVKYFSVTVSTIPPDRSNVSRFSYVIEDISDRHQAQEKIEQSLHEKEILLKEIHHRVKNNLQISQSLIHLQALSLADQEIGEKFKEAQHRVRAMALIHEQLYRSDNLAKIDLAEYLCILGRNLFSSYRVDEQIRFRTNFKYQCLLEIDTAVPCGLIINELISNALKHAFARRQGEISIEIDSDRNHNLVLIVCDNGQGLPPDFDFARCRTLGLKLVRNLVKQLRGEIQVKSDLGTRFEITLTQVECDSLICQPRS